VVYERFIRRASEGIANWLRRPRVLAAQAMICLAAGWLWTFTQSTNEGPVARLLFGPVFGFALFIGIYGLIAAALFVIALPYIVFGEAWEGFKLDMKSLQDHLRDRRDHR
jgi:hypothetical protein